MGNCLCRLGSEQEIQHIITENLAVEFERNSTPHLLHRRINSNASTASFFEARGDTSAHESPRKYTKEVQTVLNHLDEISSKLENDSQPIDESHNSDSSSLYLSNDDIQHQLQAIHREMALLLLQVEHLTKKASDMSVESV